MEKETEEKVKRANAALKEACECAIVMFDCLDLGLPISLDFTMIFKNLRVKIDIEEVDNSVEMDWNSSVNKAIAAMQGAMIS